jgi:hypothetical protein
MANRCTGSTTCLAMGLLVVTNAAFAADSGPSLAEQSNNPNAPLTQVQLRDVFAPNVPDTDGRANSLELQVVLPFKPRDFFPFPTLMKITVPYVSAPGPIGTSAMDDIELFDQVVFKEPWGSWALGFTAVFPTATAKHIGQDRWQLGPAAAIIFTGIPNLVAGAVFQNAASVGSETDDRSVNGLAITPTLTYNLPHGWFVGYSDYDININWEDDNEVTIPLGLQVGRVFNIGKQAFNASFEGGYSIVRPDDTSTPRWVFGFELTALFRRVL